MVFRVGQVNSGHGPLALLLYFAEIITLLVVETNRYYHDEGPVPQPDVTEAEMLMSSNRRGIVRPETSAPPTTF